MNIFAAYNENDNTLLGFYHALSHDDESIPGPKVLISDEDHEIALSHMAIGGKVKIIKSKKGARVELIPVPMAKIKEKKKSNLYFKCREQIQSGFKCSIDEKEYIYPSKQGNGYFDQTNINSIAPISLWRQDENGKWEYVFHNSKELQTVQSGLTNHIELCRKHLNKLIYDIDECKDSKFEKIEWDYK